VEQDVTRITQLWHKARDAFGAERPFLFGEFGAADIMFAPVITRFVTYYIPVPDDTRAYMDAVLAHPFMQDWAKGAREEEWIIPRFERTEQGA
jgi:glutathione S-transferase